MMQQWYHGTRRPFGKGGLLLPPSLHRGPKANNLPGHNDADWVFITPYEEVAEGFAFSARGRGLPRVLTVAPLEDVCPDWATYGGDDGFMYRTQSAVVLSVRKCAATA